jgi:hypothetical protein
VLETQLPRGIVLARDIRGRDVRASKLVSHDDHFLGGVDSEHAGAGLEKIASQGS